MAKDQVLERLSRHVLHDDVVHAVVMPDVVDTDDVRMAEPGCRLSLALEAAQEVGIAAVLSPQDLDRHIPAKGEVDATVDNCHASLADHLFEPVAPVQDRRLHRCAFLAARPPLPRLAPRRREAYSRCRYPTTDAPVLAGAWLGNSRPATSVAGP